MDSVQAANVSPSVSSSPSVDIELENKVKKASEKISENLHIVANEPSLACYRLQEHIQKSLPQLVLKKLEVNQIHRELQGKCYDLEYSIQAVKSIHRSKENFRNIQELIRNAVFFKQLLSCEESQKGDRKSQQSMYQRFSGSFDLPTSLLPSMSGLSSSVSASADLKSSPLSSHRPSSSPRRTRASSVSSTPSHSSVTRVHSASCASTPKKVPLSTLTHESRLSAGSLATHK